MNDINDYEVLSIINDNEEAKELLYKKYLPLVSLTAYKLHKRIKSIGYDESDFLQEGMIGLESAIENYNQDKDSTFYTYAKKCIERRMLNVIRVSDGKKHIPLNDSYYIDSSSDIQLENLLKDDSGDPSNLIIENEAYEELIIKIKQELSNFEDAVFDLKISGFENAEIGKVLGKNKRTIVNTLSRIKKKLQKLLDMR